MNKSKKVVWEKLKAPDRPKLDWMKELSDFMKTMASVQPMTGPVGKIFKLDTRYLKDEKKT